MSYIQSQSAAVTTYAGTTASVVVFGGTAEVNGRYVYNGSTAPMYLTFGTLASLTTFTNAIAGATGFSFPNPCYAGQVTAIWPVINGSANTTQW